MVTLLTKKFIKNNEDYTNPNVRKAYGMLCSIVGIFFNVFLFGIKYFAGILSGSIAITADAFNNLSDAGSSLITLIGFKFAGMKADNDHPFGHGRVEYIAGFVVSMLIIIMGFELFKSSIDKIIHPSSVEVSLVSIGVLIVSILVKFYMTVYNKGVGKKINSKTMFATATDSASDCIATSVVLLSMLILKVFGLNVDGISGLFVAIFILYAGYSAGKETLSPLLGMAPSKDLVEKIEGIVMSYDEVVGIHDLVVHDYGPGRLMVSLHAEVPGNENIYMLHDAIDRAEMKLERQLNCDAVIHLDPIEVDNEEIMKRRKEVEALVKNIDQCLSIHDFRMVQGPTHINVIFDVVVPQDYKLKDKEIRKQVCDLVKDNFENCFAVVKIEKSYI